MNIHNGTFTKYFLVLIVGLALGFLVGFGSTRLPSDDTGMMKDDSVGGMHDAMGGMMMGLKGKSGDELEKAFLDEMMVHHQGAIDMAETLLAGTKRPELIKLGNAIITAQTGEIAQMKEWRQKWFKN